MYTFVLISYFCETSEHCLDNCYTCTFLSLGLYRVTKPFRFILNGCILYLVQHLITFKCFLHPQMYRYTPPDENSASDDPTADYMNLLGMVFSMFGLMMKVCTVTRPIYNLIINLQYDLVLCNQYGYGSLSFAALYCSATVSKYPQAKFNDLNAKISNLA